MGGWPAVSVRLRISPTHGCPTLVAAFVDRSLPSAKPKGGTANLAGCPTQAGFAWVGLTYKIGERKSATLKFLASSCLAWQKECLGIFAVAAKLE